MPSTAAIVVIPEDAGAALLRLRGRPLLSWVLAGLAAVPEIDQVLVAAAAPVDAAVLSAGGRGIRVVAGRGGRLETIRRALIRAGAVERVVIHDPRRPLAAIAGVVQLLARLEGAEVAVTAAPVRSTIKTVREGVIRGTVPREALFYPQSPIAFRAATLARLLGDHPDAVDELAAARAAGVAIAVQPAQGANPMLRTREDVELAEPLLSGGSAEGGR